jgi:hypothetical protein
MKSIGCIGAGIALLALILASACAAQNTSKDKRDDKQKKEDAVTSLQIVVTGGSKGIPVDNASVYVRYEEPRFLLSPKQIELDLKTDLEGIAKVKGVPQIKVMIQVVKHGWKPFGQYYVLDKDEQTIKINLATPPHWY